jgi:glutamate synthase domain-containing protein 1
MLNFNPLMGHDAKDISSCSIFGMMSRTGRRFTGEDITRAIELMNVRGNGLGGGLAAYGIYPKMKDYYAFHMMYYDADAKARTEKYLADRFTIVHDEPMPTRQAKVASAPPILWRYFLEPRLMDWVGSEEDYVVKHVMHINQQVDGAFVASSGKNMGVFKGVGFPEDISRFYRCDEYEGYIWTAHGRFPTNSKAWWGGAHPFCILDWTVVHNGEISSYDTNKRFLEAQGYPCALHTDTEVVVYAVDYLMRRHGLPVEIASKVMSAPLWSDIDRMDAEERNLCTELRQVYPSLLLNGPFAFVIAKEGMMMGLTDRIRLRPLVAADKDDLFYISSEESAIWEVADEPDRIWTPKGGEALVCKLEDAGDWRQRREAVQAARVVV